MASLSILFLKTASCFLRNKRATLGRNGCMVCTFRIQNFGPKIFHRKTKRHWWPFKCSNSYHHDHLGNQLLNPLVVSLSVAVDKILIHFVFVVSLLIFSSSYLLPTNPTTTQLTNCLTNSATPARSLARKKKALGKWTKSPQRWC